MFVKLINTNNWVVREENIWFQMSKWKKVKYTEWFQYIISYTVSGTGCRPLDSGTCVAPLRILQGSVWLEESEPWQSVALIIFPQMEPPVGALKSALIFKRTAFYFQMINLVYYKLLCLKSSFLLVNYHSRISRPD